MQNVNWALYQESKKKQTDLNFQLIFQQNIKIFVGDSR